MIQWTPRYNHPAPTIINIFLPSFFPWGDFKAILRLSVFHQIEFKMSPDQLCLLHATCLAQRKYSFPPCSDWLWGVDQSLPSSHAPLLYCQNYSMVHLSCHLDFKGSMLECTPSYKNYTVSIMGGPSEALLLRLGYRKQPLSTSLSL